LTNEGRYEVTPYSPPAGADKIMRLHAQTALFENGKVLLRKEAPWLHDYIAEITGFPGSRYADQVDSTTQALDHLRKNDDVSIWARAGGMPKLFSPPAPASYKLCRGRDCEAGNVLG
jgi:hypothetical protein